MTSPLAEATVDQQIELPSTFIEQNKQSEPEVRKMRRQNQQKILDDIILRMTQE